MSLINHDGDSLDCENYVSDVFDANTEIWWHCDDDSITQISDLPKGVYMRESNKKKSYVRLNRCIICCLYQNKPSEKIQLQYFQEFTSMSKINHMKKLIEDLNVFRKYFRVKQEVSDEIQTCISFIKYELQTSIENHIFCKKRKEKQFWLNGDGQKNCAL